jgi:YgiT-type zinc finger domain-containing protein
MTGMLCLICRQSEIVDGLTTVHFEREEMMFIVNNVPARVCPSCGEAYVEEQVAVRLLREAEAISVAGILDGILDFNTTPSVK